MKSIKPALKQRGSALLTALFIMTLVAICATAMSLRLQLDIYRTRLSIGSDKLYLASQATTFWAIGILYDQKTGLNRIKVGGALIDFPPSLENIYPDVITKGRLYDLQAVFNLNNLLDKKFQLVFLNLLEHALPKIGASDREKLMRDIIYAMSPYQPEHGEINQLSFYLKQVPPYLPGFQSLHSPSELRIIPHVSPILYQTLLPFITTLPEVTPININTASNALLMSLGNGLNERELNELLQARGTKGFKNINALNGLLEKLNIPMDQITLESTYYLAVSTTSSEDLNLTHYSVLKRIKNKQGDRFIQIISDSLNTE